MRHRSVPTAAIVADGALLGLVPIVHLHLHEEPLLVTLVGVGIPLAASLGLLAAGVWLHRSGLSYDDGVRIAGWCFGAQLAVAALGSTMLVHIAAGEGAVLPAESAAFEVATVAAGGALAGVGIGFYDVRSRRQREALRRERNRLERAERTHREVFDGARDVMMIYDADGTIQAANRAVETELGYDVADLVGEPVSAIQPADGVLDRLENGDGIVETEVLRAGGSRVPVEVARTEIEYFGREATLAVARNVSDRRERERELGNVRERMEHALSNTGSVVFEVDTADGSVSRHGDFEALFDVPVEAVPTWETFAEHAVHPDDRDRVRRFLRRMVDGRSETSSVEFRTNPETGSVRWIDGEMYATPAADGDSRRLLGVARDVTERHERVRQLKVLDRVLRHNLHNEMAIVRGYAQSIENLESPDAGTAATYAGQIVRACDGLLATVGKQREVVDLLGERPDPVRHDVAHLARKLSASMDDRFPEARIEVDCPDRAHVHAVPQLERALEELLENALVHTDRDAPTVTVDVSRADEAIRFSVADDGPAIPREEREVLTEGDEIGPLYHGSGLGLWLVHWIVTRSDGTVDIAENQPRGNVVTLTFPRRADAGTVAPLEESATEP